MVYLFVVSFILLWMSCESGLRIIGGRDALQDEFHYVVRLELKINESPEETIDNYFQFCTGAALTSKWVLSAAHCQFFDDPYYDKTKMFIRYNSHLPENNGLLAPFLETIVHPGYAYSEPSALRFDFLIIRSDNIKLSQYGKVNAVDFKSLVGHEALSIGFGRTNSNTFHRPMQVLKGMLSSCPEREIYTSQMICLVRQCSVTATICGGDSGGPIVHPAGIVGINTISMDDCDEYAKIFQPTAGSSASIISPVSTILDWMSNYCK